MQYTDYTIHPYAQKVPDMGAHDYAQFKASLEMAGLQQPITTYQGTIADGRHRLKACLELGIEPRFEEYTGSLPIEQYILSTNIRRNLTKLQREQMIADFASVIFPQIDEEMKERRKVGLRKGNMTPVRANSVARGQTWEEGHPGTAVICERFDKTTSYDARNAREIYSKAPELLAEVTARGGLSKTAEEARKRKVARMAKPRLSATERRLAREQRMDALPNLNDVALSPEQVDPELADKDGEFISKYGFVNLHTKEQVETDRDKAAFSQWIKAARGLRAQLKELVKIGSFKQSNVESWIKRASDPAKFTVRYAEIYEMVSLIKQAGDSVSELFEWLPTQKP